jgi:hypothetical protein
MRFNGFEEFREYPKMLYNQDGASRVVGGHGEEQSLGPAWQCNSAGEPLGVIAADIDTNGVAETLRSRSRAPKQPKQPKKPKGSVASIEPDEPEDEQPNPEEEDPEKDPEEE